MTTETPPTENLPAAPKQPPAKPVDEFHADDLHTWHQSVDTDRTKLQRFAMIVMIFVVGFGGIWGSTAKLGGAIIGSGRVVAEGRNRVIQHLEGGILSDILVREGDRVEKQQIVARLEDVQVRTQLVSEQIQAAILRIQLSRRRAEIRGEESFDFPRDLPENIAKHPRVLETIDSQRSEFEALRKLRDTQIEIVKGQIEAAEVQAKGNAEVLVAQQEQVSLLEQELSDLNQLVEKELIRRSEIFARRRALADIKANVALTKQRLTQAEGEAANLLNEIRQTEQTYLRDANAALVEIQQQLNAGEERIERFVDVLDRGVIRSPVEGTVFRISKLTLGAVIQPAEALMEIFPDEDLLTIEASIEPKDIESVNVGQEARVVFPSSRNKSMSPIPGTVTYVSADTVMSEASPMGYYVARIRIEDPELTMLPGNAAEVYFRTTPKTFFQIVSEPITRFASRAFKG